MSFNIAEEDKQILQLMRDTSQVERGFRLLIGKYQERLYFHIRGIVADHEDTDDVLQNTFIKVFKNFHSFEEKSGLYTWLYRIATNESLSYLQSKNRRSTSSLEDEQLNLVNRISADSYTDNEDLQEKLILAIDKLPEKQKLVFHMRYYDEMSYEEMSKVLETSVGALKASYHHAAKKIEAFIKGIEQY
ncbi:MAG TPA: sigma-70 family RNA polymerase sigma factor [Saprospiraceae bacterium]|nr:sigma-70 family RNA polymerase sigma factor [Saprospiraceae bacterium]